MVEAAGTSLTKERTDGSNIVDPDAQNWRGLWTLYLREVRRFGKVAMQTVVAPVVTTLLFLAIFTLALGRAVDTVGGVPFTMFLAPGLIMMSIMQNSFANTSSSMVISKVQGNVVDVLMPPLSPLDMTLGFAIGGVTRGVIVGSVVAAVMALFVDLSIHSLGVIIYFMLAASLMLSLLGLIGGIWSDKFDHIAAVTNFVVTPLTFLSGNVLFDGPAAGDLVPYFACESVLLRHRWISIWFSLVTRTAIC